MPTRKKSTVKKTSGAARTRIGAVPPYGIAIREAIARGDAREMKKVAESARKYLASVQSALDTLDKSVGKKR